MKLFGWRESRAEEPQQSEENTTNDCTLRALLGNDELMTVDKAMQIPTYAACINFIADTISMLPVKLYKMENDESGKRIIKEIESDPRVRMLNGDTGDTLSASEMKAAMIKDTLNHGSSVAYINKKLNSFKSIHYVAFDEFSTVKNNDPIFKSYQITVGGERYWPHNFIKIHRATKDGVTGLGVPFENSEILSVAYQSLKFEKSQVAKGGNKKGFLKTAKKLTTDGMNALKAAWRRLYSSNDDDTVIVLNDGLEFQESSSTAVELQLNENKRTNATEICEIFKICPAVLNDKATDEEYNLTIKTAILPVLNEVTTALNRDFLLEKEKESYFYAFDTAEIMRGDIEKRYKAYEVAVKAGWITKNEIRAKENMHAIEGLDVVGMSLGDVIFDVEKKTFFTPNTGVVTDGLTPVEAKDINSEEGGKGGDS